MPMVSPLVRASVSPLAAKLSVTDMDESATIFENVTSTPEPDAIQLPFSTWAGASGVACRLKDALMSVFSMSDAVPLAMAAV